MRMLLLVVALTITVPAIPQSKNEKIHSPDCSGRGQWPTMMTLVHLKNAGLIDAKQIDSAKTKTARLASEKIGKDLWHQVYHVTFVMKSGEAIEAIAVHDASLFECSMSGVEVFVVSKHLNPEGK
jgi:hypothetical protein